MFLYTKTITISPRFIILNKTKYTIIAKKSGNVSGELEIVPDIRTPFIWKNLDNVSKNENAESHEMYKAF